MHFTMDIARGGASKALSALGAALEAQGAKVVLQPQSFSLVAELAVPSTDQEDSSTPQPIVDVLSERVASGDLSGQNQKQNGRKAKRVRLSGAGAVDAIECAGSAEYAHEADERNGRIHDAGSVYKLKVALFQETPNRVAINASVANSEPEAVQKHFTMLCESVRQDVVHILSSSRQLQFELR